MPYLPSMLATRIRQKEGTFYFVSYKAPDLLAKTRFISRYHFEGEELPAEAPAPGDEVAKFIAGIERSEGAFQRGLNRRKIAAIVNFFETAATQPLVPGAILLFTDERLKFEPIGEYKSMGNLREPEGKYLVIDGQHRVAGLHFYAERYPKEADAIEVPCVIFDGRSGDFATEMFVIINSTHTRISKSHLVDLYEKVSWESPQKKLAAKVVTLLYEGEDSPLRYKINRLGGRSRQEKWILQSELFNEVHKLVETHSRLVKTRLGEKPEKLYALVRDYFQGVRQTMSDVWGRNDRFMFTRDVTLKALLRVLGELMKQKKIMERWASVGADVFRQTVQPWVGDVAQRFRAEGFYERFPAKGQVERVRRIHMELTRALGLEPPEPEEP
ncbi:MAG: DGQHR domain-containing protein [Planctomycetes bacterium]|nr:DGQHR domain-containing protein [Planctomycetota bacterium]